MIHDRAYFHCLPALYVPIVINVFQVDISGWSFGSLNSRIRLKRYDSGIWGGIRTGKAIFSRACSNISPSRTLRFAPDVIELSVEAGFFHSFLPSVHRNFEKIFG